MSGKTVLVTGGTRGIGAAVAERYRSDGYHVVTPVRAELELSDAGAVSAFAERIGQVDILINNAAEHRPAPLENIEAAEFTRSLGVNVVAPFLLIKTLGVAMGRRGFGRVVNIGSVYGIVSKPNRSMYTSGKAAIIGLTTSAAVELAPHGVLVNAVCPGFVDTDLTRQNNTPEEIARLAASVPLGRLSTPEEIAELVVFLGSERNTYITGQAIAIDGGFLCQ
jgi:3-oxoacyl-[acyl-carrier protein] reductase